MKYIIGFLVAVVLLGAGYALANYVQDFATPQGVANWHYGNGDVQRFEWFDDVCYMMVYNTSLAISCLKK